MHNLVGWLQDLFEGQCDRLERYSLDGLCDGHFRVEDRISVSGAGRLQVAIVLKKALKTT